MITTNEFSKQFNLSSNGFIDYNSYINTKLGFSVKKRFKGIKDGNVSLISLYIRDEDLINQDIIRKPLRLMATYGKEESGGVVIRDSERIDFSKPVDIQNFDEYFYDYLNNKFYSHNKEITAELIINRFYKNHIKITKTVIGLWLRMKFVRIQLLYPSYSNFIFRCWGILLYTFTQIKYTPTYNRIKDDKILSYLKSNESIFDFKIINKEIKERKKESILGLKFSRWGIYLFSIFHFLIFTFIFFKIIVLPNVIEDYLKTISKNNFLVVVYAYLVLSIQDIIIPKIIISRICKRIDKVNLIVDKPIKL